MHHLLFTTHFLHSNALQSRFLQSVGFISLNVTVSSLRDTFFFKKRACELCSIASESPLETYFIRNWEDESPLTLRVTFDTSLYSL